MRMAHVTVVAYASSGRVLCAVPHRFKRSPSPYLYFRACIGFCVSRVSFSRRFVLFPFLASFRLSRFSLLVFYPCLPFVPLTAPSIARPLRPRRDLQTVPVDSWVHQDPVHYQTLLPFFSFGFRCFWITCLFKHVPRLSRGWTRAKLDTRPILRRHRCFQ